MTTTNSNPLLQPWTAPYGLPPFDAIRPEHFVPAFEQAMRSHLRRDRRDRGRRRSRRRFDNTIAAFDRSGRELARIEKVFFNLTASETSPALQAVEREMSPRLAAHHSAIYLDARAVRAHRRAARRRANSGLPPSSCGCCERVHLDFVRAGARLSARRRRGTPRSSSAWPR